MSIPLFAHDANAAVDRPLCHKSHHQVMVMLQQGQVRVLYNAKGKEWAVQFKVLLENTLASQLSIFLAAVPDVGDGKTTEQLLELFKNSRTSSTAISDRENRANIGEPSGPGGELSPVEILRAQIKLKAWPLVGDEKAPRIRGKS